MPDVTHHNPDTALRSCGLDTALHSLQPADLSKTPVAVEVEDAGTQFARHSGVAFRAPRLSRST